MHTGSWNHKENKGNLFLPDASIIPEVDRKLKPVLSMYLACFSIFFIWWDTDYGFCQAFFADYQLQNSEGTCVGNTEHNKALLS